MKNIVFIGMPGSGKSRIGRIVAKKIGYDFYDMDKYTEKDSGKKISEMFLDGEEVFRDAETKASQKLGKLENTVISTGGGVVLREENMKHLKENGYVVYIKRDIDEIKKSKNITKRPMLKNDTENRLKQLYDARKKLYEEYADFTLYNNESFQKCVNIVVRKLQKGGLTYEPE